MARFGDPGCTLDDLVMRPEDYRRFGFEPPEERERQEAMSKFGDPGCTLDDLAMRPEDYKRFGLEMPEQRSRRASDPARVAERRFSGNVIDLTKMRKRRLSERT